MQQNEGLEKEFLECCQGSSLDNSEKKKMYEEMVISVCNARFGTVLTDYKDKTIGRQGSKREDQSLREKLKSVTSNEAGL